VTLHVTCWYLAPRSSGKRRRPPAQFLRFVFAWSAATALTRPILGDAMLGTSELTAATESAARAPAVQPNGGIYVVGAAGAFESLREVVGRDRIGPIAVSWFRLDRLAPETLLAASAATDPDVRCWIDLNHSDRVSLYFADRSSERFLVREIALAKGLTELEQEALAQIVEMSLVALIEDATLGISRAKVKALLLARDGRASKPARAVRRATPIRSPDVSWRALAGVSYALEAYSPEIPWVHGPGAALGVSRRSQGSSTSLALRVGYQLPQSHRTGLTGVSLTALRLRSGLTFDVPLNGSLSLSTRNRATLGVLVAAGTNVVFVKPLPGLAAFGVRLESTTTIWIPVLGAGCRITQPFNGWSMSLLANVDIDLERVSYDLRQNGDLLPVVRPHRIRPSVLAEAAWP
jgi:hypothetical protein